MVVYAVASVKQYHKGWEYRLWTDEQLDAYVREHHPRFHPVFAGLNRHIMRVDVSATSSCKTSAACTAISYEFVRPFDYGDADLVLSLEYDEAFSTTPSSIRLGR